MGLLDAVTDFVDGETPDEAKMNLLRNVLIALFDGTGVPSSALQWPMVAGGILDMNGYSLQNVGDLYNVIHVNGGTTLSDAVASLPVTGGTIVIDPGTTADSTVGGIDIDKPNVTIMGMGDSSVINISDTTSARAGIVISADNFTLRGVRITSDASPSNLTALIELDGTHASKIVENSFVSPDVPAVSMGTGTAYGDAAFAAIVHGNHFYNASDACINVENAQYCVISNNGSTSCSGDCIVFGATGYTYRIAVAGNQMYTTGSAIISATSAYDGNRSACSFVGNVFNATTAACDLGFMYNSAISGNTFDGPVVIDLRQCTFDGNICNTTTAITTAYRTSITGNRFAGAVTIAGTNYRAMLSNNFFQTDVTIPATSGIWAFVGNTVQGAIVALTSSDVEFFGSNYASGGIT